MDENHTSPVHATFAKGLFQSIEDLRKQKREDWRRQVASSDGTRYGIKSYADTGIVAGWPTPDRGTPTSRWVYTREKAVPVTIVFDRRPGHIYRMVLLSPYKEDLEAVRKAATIVTYFQRPSASWGSSYVIELVIDRVYPITWNEDLQCWERAIEHFREKLFPIRD